MRLPTYPSFFAGLPVQARSDIAREMHEQSRRKYKPYVTVDCGAIPEELAASEFFGHRKGSFTGADSDKPGLFQEADGGTLFLTR